MTPSVIMIAGPNGSGKTTLTWFLLSCGLDLGEYINPDDIATELEGDYRTRVEQAQQEADRRRAACLAAGRSFTFETVMSHPSKLDIFKQAREKGFRTVLYFVGLENPAENVARVALRVARGGHDVPEDRIIARYHRSMGSLHHAVALSDHAFVYDNSRALAQQSAPRLFVEIRDLGVHMQIRALPMPRWIETHLLMKLVVK